MIAWPEGKRFAFTVFDDTDRATATNVNEVYALLRDLGMRTTKSVWPIAGPRHPTIPGDTCEDDDYRAFTLELADQGFEIGYHNATYHGVDRAETERALERFRAIYGHYPRAAANHADNDDALYWGAARLDGASRLVYRALQRFRGPRFFGHVAGDRRFWGDLCQRHIDYFRNFVFEEMDTLEACPYMPYFDPHRPYVTRWFASAEGATVADYNTTIREEAQDRLVAQGGACIMYTHFAKGFQDGSRLDRRFVELMTRLARLDGWFVPTSELLDHIVAHRATVDGSGVHLLTDDERRDLERRWLAQRIRSRIRAALVR